MISEKIPRIECVLLIPELIGGELNNLIMKMKSLTKVKRIKKRIKTCNYIKNLILKSKESNELVNDFEIPNSDAISFVAGKLVLESGDSLRVQGSQNGALKVTLSVLESAND